MGVRCFGTPWQNMRMMPNLQEPDPPRELTVLGRKLDVADVRSSAERVVQRELARQKEVVRRDATLRREENTLTGGP